MTNLKLKRGLYIQGITWFILSLAISVLNDVIAKYTGDNLPGIQVAFLRFTFSVITLLPFMFYYGKSSFNTERPSLHIIRGALLFVGITLWCYGLRVVPLASATVINFTIPFFVLFLASIFLKEKVGLMRWFATIVGFIGIYIVLDPNSSSFHMHSLILLISALMFASLDVINKKYVIKETMLSMLFYSALATTVMSMPFALYKWVTPSIQELGLLFVLGGGANLILFMLLKAFALVDASAAAPFRYVELFLSVLLGYYFFNEVLVSSFWLGAVIIVSSSFFVGYMESRRQD